jgi:hypothetical protein
MSDRIPHERHMSGDADGVTEPQHVTDTAPDPSKAQTSVHPAVIEIALAAALWFIAVTWVSFAGAGGIDWILVVVTLFFAFFFALFLFTASYGLKDARWRQRNTTLREFLDSEVGTATGPVSGREVLLEIAVMPVSLALAATVIGLIWVATR